MDLIHEQEIKKKILLQEAKKEQIEKINKKNEGMQAEKVKQLWEKFEFKDQKVSPIISII